MAVQANVGGLVISLTSAQVDDCAGQLARPWACPECSAVLQWASRKRHLAEMHGVRGG